MMNKPARMTEEERVERNNKMVYLVMRGYTLKQVGQVFEITGARVRDIVLRGAHQLLGIDKIQDPRYNHPGILMYKYGLTELRKKYKYRLVGMLKPEE